MSNLTNVVLVKHNPNFLKKSSEWDKYYQYLPYLRLLIILDIICDRVALNPNVEKSYRM